MCSKFLIIFNAYDNKYCFAPEVGSISVANGMNPNLISTVYLLCDILQQRDDA